MADIKPDITEDEIRKLYRGAKAQRPILLTAETSGLIVGTYTLQRPDHGSRAGEGSRLAVDKDYRRKHIATLLMKAGNALMFSDAPDGFDCNLAQVFVIIHIPGAGRAQDAYAKEGYVRQTEREGATRSWSNERGILVDRSSQPMLLQRTSYKLKFPGDHEKYFPKQRLPKVV